MSYRIIQEVDAHLYEEETELRSTLEKHYQLLLEEGKEKSLAENLPELISACIDLKSGLSRGYGWENLKQDFLAFYPKYHQSPFYAVEAWEASRSDLHSFNAKVDLDYQTLDFVAGSGLIVSDCDAKTSASALLCVLKWYYYKDPQHENFH